MSGSACKLGYEAYYSKAPPGVEIYIFHLMCGKMSDSLPKQ